MALFSDVDWVILLAVAAFLLLGKESGATLRTLGRWYGRAGKIKQELLAEFARAADLPPMPSGTPLSIRGALLGIDPTPTRLSGIPATVREPPSLPLRVPATPSAPWTGGYPVPTWTMTVPVAPEEVDRHR